jgi:hypothetical protein
MGKIYSDEFEKRLAEAGIKVEQMFAESKERRAALNAALGLGEPKATKNNKTMQGWLPADPEKPNERISQGWGVVPGKPDNRVTRGWAESPEKDK